MKNKKEYLITLYRLNKEPIYMVKTVSQSTSNFKAILKCLRIIFKYKLYRKGIYSFYIRKRK